MEQEYGNVYPQPFEIIQVLERRRNPKTNKEEFLVQWKKWPNDPTWEPRCNIQNHVYSELFFQQEDYCDTKNQKVNSNEKKKSKEQTKKKSSNSSGKHDSFQSFEEDGIYQKVDQKYGNLGEVKIYPEEENKEGNFLEFDKIVAKKEQNGIVEYLVSSASNQNNIILFINQFNLIQQTTKEQDKKEWYTKDELSEFQQEIEKFEQEEIEKQKSQQFQKFQIEDSQIVLKKYDKPNEVRQVRDIYSHMKDDTQYDSMNSTASSTERLNMHLSTQYPQKQSSQNEEFLGSLQSDQIDSVDVEISYKIHWKERPDKTLPLPMFINLKKETQLQPQELIDWLQIYHLK